MTKTYYFSQVFKGEIDEHDLDYEIDMNTEEVIVYYEGKEIDRYMIIESIKNLVKNNLKVK